MIYCWFTSNWKYFFDNIWDLYFLLSCFLNAIWKTTFKMDFVPLWLVLERDYSNAMAVLKIIYLQKITIHATKINCKGSPDNGVLFSVIFGTDCPMSQVLSSAKEEKILKGSLDSISSPSVKIQIMGGKVCLRREGKTLLDIVNKLFAFKILFTTSSNVLPLQFSWP